MRYSFLKFIASAWILLMMPGATAVADPIGPPPIVTGVGTTDADGDLLMNSIVGPNINSATLVNYISRSEEIIPGIVIENQSGTFEGGLNTIGIEDGIILTSGSVRLIPLLQEKGIEEIGDENSGFDRWNTQWDPINAPSGDSDLSSLVDGARIFDPNILEFEFTLDESQVSWDLHLEYVFASEEYVNFVNSQFNDAFGFFIDGVNYATLDNGDVVSANTINPLTNSEFYRNNVPNTDETGAENPYGYLNLDFEPDGLTTVLTLQSPTLFPGQHTMKLIIGDVEDSQLDSGVFIRSDSFYATPTIPEPGTLILLGSGLLGLVVLRNYKRRN